MGAGEVMIPLMAIILSIGGPLVILLVILMNRHRLSLQKYNRIQEALESGKTPEEVERMIDIIEKAHFKPKRKRNGYLRAGVVMIGMGFASAVVGASIGVSECLAAAGGAVVLGLSLVAVWFIVDRKQETAE